MGFEPTVAFTTPVFKTGTLNLSVISLEIIKMGPTAGLIQFRASNCYLSNIFYFFVCVIGIFAALGAYRRTLLDMCGPWK